MTTVNTQLKQLAGGFMFSTTMREWANLSLPHDIAAQAVGKAQLLLFLKPNNFLQLG